MQVTLKIKELSFETGGDGGIKMSGKYKLMNGCHLLAVQEFNGYGNNVKLPMSAEVATHLKALADKVKAELETITGLNDDAN